MKQLELKNGGKKYSLYTKSVLCLVEITNIHKRVPMKKNDIETCEKRHLPRSDSPHRAPYPYPGQTVSHRHAWPLFAPGACRRLTADPFSAPPAASSHSAPMASTRTFLLDF